MDVGIGLPNAVRGVDRSGVVEWAQKAEEAGFSSLGTVKGYLSAFEDAGADEVILFPASPDPHQVELLADAAF